MIGLWSARLAPVGVPSVDGRVIDPAAVIGRPAPPMYAYLVTFDAEHGRIRLGVVDEVIVREGWLTAAGELFVPTGREQPHLDRVRAGDLFPEMDLMYTRSEQDPAPADGSMPLLRFSSGVVAAVVAGRAPAWPDSRFHLEES